jgi:hypothetical protein
MRVLLIAIPVVLTVFAIVDIAVVDRSRIRALPRVVWVLIALLPVLGPVLWFFVGRIRSSELGAAPAAPPAAWSGPVAPDDDPDFLGRLHREQEQEDRIRELERKLEELRDDKPRPED